MYFAENTNVGFVPVVVSKGRLFKGRGYMVCEVVKSYTSAFWRQIPMGDGTCYWSRDVTSEKAKIWVPELNAFRYANVKYVEKDNTVSDEMKMAIYRQYCDYIVGDTVKFCRESLAKRNVTDNAEVMKFAKNCLRKHHAEIEMPIVEDILHSYGL